MPFRSTSQDTVPVAVANRAYGNSTTHFEQLNFVKILIFFVESELSELCGLTGEKLLPKRCEVKT